jgi:hypothetical protein
MAQDRDDIRLAIAAFVDRRTKRLTGHAGRGSAIPDVLKCQTFSIARRSLSVVAFLETELPAALLASTMHQSHCTNLLTESAE